MKQYTTPAQTAKLIELGFEKPKSEVKAEQAGLEYIKDHSRMVEHNGMITLTE